MVVRTGLGSVFGRSRRVRTVRWALGGKCLLGRALGAIARCRGAWVLYRRRALVFSMTPVQLIAWLWPLLVWTAMDSRLVQWTSAIEMLLGTVVCGTRLTIHRLLRLSVAMSMVGGCVVRLLTSVIRSVCRMATSALRLLMMTRGAQMLRLLVILVQVRRWVARLGWVKLLV